MCLFDLQAFGTKGEELRAKASSSRQKAEEAKASLAASKGEDAMLSGLKKLSEMGRLSGFHVSRLMGWTCTQATELTSS